LGKWQARALATAHWLCNLQASGRGFEGRIAVTPSATVAPAVYPATLHDRGRFFIAYAAICLIIAVGGFVPTFWVPMFSGGDPGRPIVILHGLVFTAWPLLFLWQTWLVEHDRLRDHRAFGVAGVSLATLLLVIGLATAIDSFQARIVAGYEIAARKQMIVPVSNIVLFVGFFVAAVASQSRRDWHKRLMMIATAQTLTAPLARWIFVVAGERELGATSAVSPPARPIQALRPAIIVLALFVGAMLYDRKRRGYLHPAWPIGIAITVGVAILRVPLAETAAWQRTADFLARF
jgi:hypothetical protein